MASKITAEDIIKINQVYIQYHTYAETARQTGFSPSTVKKYIQKDFTPSKNIEIHKFEKKDLPEFTGKQFKGIKNWGDLCIHTEKELEEIRELWKELSI